MIGGSDLMGRLHALAGTSAREIEAHYAAHLRPRLAAMLIDAAVVEIDKASGRDVAISEAALAAEAANLALEQRDILVQKARALAFNALVLLVSAL